MSFDHPAFLLLLFLAPIDLVMALRREARRFPALLSLQRPSERSAVAGRRRILSRLSAIGGALFIIAASLVLSRPGWGSTRELVEREGLEIAIVIDVSRSMLAEDLPPPAPGASASRLSAALAYARLAIGKAPGAAFSLTAVKGEGLLLVPMSDDIEALNSGLAWAGPGVMTQAGTDLGSGIYTALASFSSLAARGKLILMLSDGGDLAGRARAAALKARERGIRLLVVGFGGDKPVPIPLGNGSFLDDGKGKPVRVVQDSALLRDVASAGGGRYVDAMDTTALAALSDEIAREGRAGFRLDERSQDRTGLFSGLALLSLLLRFASSFFAQGGPGKSPARLRDEGLQP